MKTVEINGKKYDLPTSYGEIQFKRYVEIFQGISGKKDETISDKITVISKLLGEERETVEQLPLEAFNLLFDAVSWLFVPGEEKPRDSVTIDNWTYTITPMEKWPLKKYISAENIAKEGDGAYCRLLSAILTDNDGYDDKKVEELTKKVENARTSDMLPLLAFFLECRRLSELNTLLCSAISDMERTVQEAQRRGR